MPSGKTHDVITIAAAPFAFAAVLAFGGGVWLAMVATVGLLFGGLMFGPDLDTVSKQYSRWWLFRFLWFPYRTFFKHRSRWSHGLMFGTLLRVVYFMGISTSVAFAITYAVMAWSGGGLPDVWDFARAWELLRTHADRALGEYGLIYLFFGMWIGAASHTFTDIAGTYVKTGRV